MLDINDALSGSASPQVYKASAGVRLEPVGDMWAAYSPSSGETQLLNVESAVILEWLLEVGGGSALQAAAALSADAGFAIEELAPRIELAWGPLAAAGLIVVASVAARGPQP